MPQLDPGNGKTKKVYLWAYRSNDLQPGPKIIVFDYQSGRSGRHAQQFLGDWHGHLLVDDYAGYKALFTTTRAHPETQRLLEPCIKSRTAFAPSLWVRRIGYLQDRSAPVNARR